MIKIRHEKVIKCKIIITAAVIMLIVILKTITTIIKYKTA